MSTLSSTAANRPALRAPARLAQSARAASAPFALLLVPIAFLTVMVFWPLVQEVWLSLTDGKLTAPTRGSFVGLDNYLTLFTGQTLPVVLLNTGVYTLGTTALALVSGVAAALVLSARFRGHRIVRAVLAAPWAVPGVASALIWLWMFSQSSGILNRALEATGLPRVAWLTSTPWAMISVIVVTAWQFAPFVMLVTLAALQSVPDEVAEASRVDGAPRLATFRFVTWPHIVPTVRLVAILQIIWCLRRWDLITILTGGGPVNATETIVVALQRQAFDYQQVGSGAAYAVIGIAIAVVFALAYLVLERRDQKRSSR